MKIKDAISVLEADVPLAYAEDFDNVGLLVGDKNTALTGILVTLDTLEEVVDEAIQKKCNLIISFHPIVFKGLKSITGKNYVERVVLKAIKNDIAIYAIHTALDNHINGVNKMICDQLKVKNPEILIPQKNTLKKLTTYAPTAHSEKIRQALFNAGAGSIANYSECSFTVSGNGTFKGNENSNPTIGTPNVLQVEPEEAINVIIPKHLEYSIITTLKKEHPYEEVAYEITPIDNSNQTIGMGMIGELETPLSEAEFLNYLKKEMNTNTIRHSEFLGKPIKRIAVLGGSGSFAIGAAKAKGADIFISSDFKYHDFFSAEKQLLLADIGHYESEQFTKNGLVAILRKKILNFAVLLSEINTNPVKYF